MLRILLGRARTGKSARVLEEIRTLGDSSQQILLVPEHASHVAEVDVCRACGVTASRHAEVLTFKLLASRVLTLTGGAAEVTLDNGGKLLLLQRVLVSLAPSLRVYRRPSQRAAFLESLLALIEELQAYAVAPEVLAEKAEAIAGESGERLRDVALLYGSSTRAGAMRATGWRSWRRTLRPPATPTIRTFFSTAFPTSRAASGTSCAFCSSGQKASP